MPAYATQADVEAYIEGWVTDDAAALERALERASDDVDDAIGPLGILTTGAYAGRKIDPTTLEDWQAKRLSDATCAQFEHRYLNPGAHAGAPRATTVKGPDFEQTFEAPAGRGRYAPDLACKLRPLGLPRRTARLG